MSLICSIGRYIDGAGEVYNEKPGDEAKFACMLHCILYIMRVMHVSSS